MNKFTDRHSSGHELQRRIMRRVYGLWFWKSVAPMLAVEFILLAGVAAGVLVHISVRHIMLNAFSASADGWAFFKFFVSNFFVKSVQSRLLFGVYLVFALFFIRDLSLTFRRLGGFGRDELAGLFVASGPNRPQAS